MRKLILFFCLLVVFTCSGQSKVTLSVHQDARLLFLGDDRSNPAGTINLLAKLEIKAFKKIEKHLVFYPGIEQGFLTGSNFQRYFLGLGHLHRFNQKIGFGVFIDYGVIVRSGVTYPSASGSLELSYRLNNKTTLSFVPQFTERSDLRALYDPEDDTRLSGFVGLKFHL